MPNNSALHPEWSYYKKHRNRLVLWWTQIFECVLWYVHLAAHYQTIDRHMSQFLAFWLKAIAELDFSSITQSITAGQGLALM